MAATDSKSFLMRKEDVQPEWFVVDGDRQIVGRLASKIARVLQGKHKPKYTPHVDTGDYVVVVNCENVRFSGAEVAHASHPQFTAKFQFKEYEKYTGYPGGRRIKSGLQIHTEKPEFVLYEAVRRMMPKSKLGRQMLKKLKLVVGPEHRFQAQQPKALPEHLLP